jgi:hypothetical protein
MLPKNVLYFGGEASLARSTLLCAGPSSLSYEAGDLRYIKLGHREIPGRIYVSTRDRVWGTLYSRWCPTSR